MSTRQYIFAALVVVILLAAGWFLRVIFLYVVIAAVLTMITKPFERKLENVKIGKRKIPRTLRAIVVLLSIYIVVFAFISIFIPLIADEVNIISNVDSKQLSVALHKPLSQMESAFNMLQHSQQQAPAPVHPRLEDATVNSSPDNDNQTFEQYVQAKAGELLGVAQISSLANGVASVVGKILIGFLIVSFFTFFFIRDGVVIMETLLLLIPPKHVNRVRHIITNSQAMLTKYFTGVLLDVLFVSTFVGCGLALLGIRNALIIGLFAGIMNIIPYVGPLIGGAFAIVIGISSNLNLEFYSELLPLAGKIILVFVGMNLTDGFLVQPFIFSNSVKAHPIEIFTVILIAGTLAGIGGMVVAVPVYTIVRVVAKEFFSKYRFVQRLTDEMQDSTSPANK